MEMLNYIAGGVSGCQRDIRRLDKRVRALTKLTRDQRAGTLLIVVGTLMLAKIILMKVDKLSRDVEELKLQKGV